MTNDFHEDSLKDYLPIYYHRLFPYRSYCTWLSFGTNDESILSRREFSFTLSNNIYLRYQSFSSFEELKAEMIKKLPHKIDIGAIYNAKPSEHKKKGNFVAQEKEIVFDIDLTDYDDVRTCCSGASICSKCWQFIVVGVKILDRALREDFGFSHLLWVYSGRRGVHCWVSDPSARVLGSSGRAAIAEYLQVLSGGDSKVKKVQIRSKILHPSLSRALNIIAERFERLILVDQDVLGTVERWNKVLSLIPDEGITKEIESSFMKASNSIERWQILRKRMESYIHKSDFKVRKTSEHILKEIMLQYSYPRLDINVTKGLNHLLKSPFCIHPKTGKICIPFDPLKVETFDPLRVPTISSCTEEIDKFAKEESHKNISTDYKKTSLREPIKIFDEFVSKLSLLSSQDKKNGIDF